MAAQMNIKSDEAYMLASELAEQAGTSLTQAVLEALRARKRTLAADAKLQRVMALSRDTAARLSAGTLELDHGEFLYDEAGLPK
jgi:antitoxin VapB